MHPETKKYFEELGKETQKNYAIAKEARKKGLDPVDDVEVPLALTMAAKVVRLIATIYPQLDKEEIINRILELEKQYGALDSGVSFKIAEEIAQEKYCKFENQFEAMDAGIRVGFAYTTLGVVSSPIEGYTGIKTGKTQKGETYLKAFFSGPIRSAGTTAGCVGLMLIDYIRQLFGYARFDPVEKECKRLVTELYDYHERVNNLQYLPTEEEIYFIAKNLPIQVSGDPTEKREVSNYKNLERVETDLIRGGLCLILGEGMAQKAAKGLRILKGLQKNGFQIRDWEWLEEYTKLHEKRNLGKTDASPTYIKDLVAGRPVFGHPGRGFRFRYGRSRVAGFSAVSIHPATMAITYDFIATGTQLKIEKPTKGCVVTPCDCVDGPIVKLKNDAVRKIQDYLEAKEIYKEIKEVLYLGDLLFPLGDVINRNALLVKPGYVEEWWNLELEKQGGKIENYFNVGIGTAVNLSNQYLIPLHPSYIFYWTEVSYDLFLSLIDWLGHSRVSEGKLILPYTRAEKERFQKGKRALELLGVPHEIGIENVILSKESTSALLINLGFERDYEGELHFDFIFDKEGDTLATVNKLSKFKIKDKAGEFIGSRMGRPEKAKLRKLTGSPNVLFPVGSEGGRLRSVNAALEVGSVKSTFPFYYCNQCQREGIYRVCEICGARTQERYYCKLCGKNISGKTCKAHESGTNFKEMRIDLKHYFGAAKEILGMTNYEVPVLIKGVRGTSSGGHHIENLAKGFLRAKHNLCVNKDGTIRYDMTELPISHFKPCEVEVSAEKLRELGYNQDYLGQELKEENQILELKPHDIIIPCNSLCGDEKADEVFLNVSKFIDELLVKLYKLPPFYNLKKREDLVGQLGVCMAPHNCAGVICRIIGFSKVQGLLASPYMHAAMRRDCFDYHTFIPIKENGNWKIIKIGDLVEKLNPNKIIDGYGTKEKEVESFETLGFSSKSLKLKEIKVNNFTKHEKIPMIEIKTALGKKIRVTDNHKFLIDGKIKRASDLKIGDKLPLTIRIDISPKQIGEINLLERFKDEGLMIRGIKSIISSLGQEKTNEILKKLNISKKQFQNYHGRDSYPRSILLFLDDNTKKKVFERGKMGFKRDHVDVPIIIKLDEDLLEIIGLYIAEGYSRALGGKKGLNQVYISGFDLSIQSLIKSTIWKHFGLRPTENKRDRVTFSSKILYKFFIEFLCCGSSAGEKRIPYLLLDLELDKLAGLLRGYFEGDGSAEKRRKKICCDSVSAGLLYDLEFCLSRFGIFAKRYEYEKEPGNVVKEFYIKRGRQIPKFKITKLIIGADFIKEFKKIGFLSKKKKDILKSYEKMKNSKMKIYHDSNFVYDPVVFIETLGAKESYCLNVDDSSHLVVANSIITKNCDGDEAALMLLADVLINFSRCFLPAHRGGTQDAPLVLNGMIFAREVDDQILDFELVNNYPLELYEKAEKKLHSSEIKIETVKQRIAKSGIEGDPYVNTGFTHNSTNFNQGATCSSYKTLPTMKDKVAAQMDLCVKLRSVDEGDVARLIIDRHFMRDLKGNLRKFTQQGFRCSTCNKIYRRPPLNGRCDCSGNIIFTIAYGSIVKYLEHALSLTRNYNVPPYIKQDLELTKRYIESIFGKDNEKQENINRWF